MHMHCQVITGPNASGKSCYVKQVALIVYMAHLGGFVPASSAVVGLTDAIFTRVASLEHSAVGGAARSLMQRSTFLIDLSQVSAMLRRATPRSLIVIDEFGKGTLAADGVGLLCATLSHFASCAPLPPRLLACTHFHEAFDEAYLPRHDQLHFFTMEVMTTTDTNAATAAAGRGETAAAGRAGLEGAAAATGGAARLAPAASAAAAAVAAAMSTSPEDSVFLYRLVPGYCAPSFGLRCAEMCGVRREVVARAAAVVAALIEGRPVERLQGLAPEGRGGGYLQLVRRLLDLDPSDAAGVSALLKDVADAACRAAAAAALMC